MVKTRTVKKRTCPTCKKEYTSKHFARHVRTCKGPIIDGKRECLICKTWILSKNMARHHARKHPNGDPDELTQLRTENRKLLQKLSDKDAKLADKDAKLAEKDDRLISTMAQNTAKLAEKDATIIKKTERIHQLEMQMVTAKAKTTINNTYNTILINRLEPMSLDPKDPGFKECMAEFVNQLHERMNVIGDAENCDEYKYSRICRKTGLDFLFNGKKARYVLTDLARRKGVYLAPDGILRFDENQKTAAYFYKEGIYQNWTMMKDRHEFADHFVRAVGKGRKNFCEKLKTDGFNLYNIMRQEHSKEQTDEGKKTSEDECIECIECTKTSEDECNVCIECTKTTDEDMHTGK